MPNNSTYRLPLIGPPGSGKGTYAERLARRFDIPHIATGDMLREAVKNGSKLGEKVKQYLDKGELVPDDVMIEVIRDRLARDDAQKGFSLDGFPRTLEQAKMLDETMGAMDADFDYIFYVWASPDEIVERTVDRVQCENCGKVYNLKNNPPAKDNVCDVCGGKVYQRDDDTEETVRRRLDVYEEKTRPIIEHYSNHSRFFKIYTGGPVGVAEVEMLKIIDETGRDE